LDGPLDGLDCVLQVDEDFTHPFRLSALVCLRQCIRNVATLLYLTVPTRNQLSNRSFFLSQSGHLLNPRFAPAGFAYAQTPANTNAYQRASLPLPEPK
jgi:hypothetical protein